MWPDTPRASLWACLRQWWQGRQQPEGDWIERIRQMAAAREQLGGLLGEQEEGVYVLDGKTSRFHFVSPGAARVCQRPLEALAVSRDWPEAMIHPDDRGRLAAFRQGLVEQGQCSGRYRIVLPSNDIRWVQDSARYVKDPVCGDYILGVIQDVSRQTVAIQARNQAEKSLRLLEQALAASANGVVITDMSTPSQPIIYANTAFQRITGYPLDEVLGQNCRFLQGEEGSPGGIDQLRQAIAAGEECTVTLRNFRKDGSRFWNCLSVSPIRDEFGKVTHYVGVQQDITEFMESAQALAESERRLTLSFDAINEGVWDYFVQRNRVYVASSWTRVVGYEETDLPDGVDALWFAVHPDDLARAQRALDSHLKGKTPLFQAEYRMRCKDGHEIWVESRGRVVEQDAAGQPKRVVGSITDITERYGFEQQIMEWNARMDSIFTLSPDGFVYFDQNRRVEYANPAFEIMTGMPIGQILNRDSRAFTEALVAAADPSQPCDTFVADMDLEGLLSGEREEPRTRRGTIHLLKPELRVLAYDLRRTPNGESLVLYLRDVTRETEVDRMKSEFLSTAAHELRTPMASVMGFSELLLRREYKPEIAKDMLDTIHRQSKRLTNLLNELLDLARIEARGGKDFKLKHQSVGPIVCDALMALQSQEGHNQPVLHMPDDLPDVNVDEAKIQQAILNILSNAYKYSPEGGEVKVDVLVRPQEIGVQVSDQGIGMSEPQLARLFERFFRADPSGNIPGTGLGMSLVKEIVELHGGRVEATSELGVGTTITLWLPQAQIPALAQAA